MKLRGTRRLSEITAMGIMDARLFCRDCRHVSPISFSKLRGGPNATYDAVTSIRTACPECESLRTHFLPLALEERYFD